MIALLVAAAIAGGGDATLTRDCLCFRTGGGTWCDSTWVAFEDASGWGERDRWAFEALLAEASRFDDVRVEVLLPANMGPAASLLRPLVERHVDLSQRFDVIVEDVRGQRMRVRLSGSVRTIDGSRPLGVPREAKCTFQTAVAERRTASDALARLREIVRDAGCTSDLATLREFAVAEKLGACRARWKLIRVDTLDEGRHVVEELAAGNGADCRRLAALFRADPSLFLSWNCDKQR